MAKKIINSYYTFDAANDVVTVPGFVKKEELFIITDVTNNKILYNFADTTRGFDSVEYDAATETTKIYLSADVSSLGCTDSDSLQIIIDRVNEKIDVADSLLDPVHKIRMSTPENLIDTDFEYGLQPTKWETLEMSNWVPSFYISEGDQALNIVESIDALDGSNVITIRTTEPSGLAVGTPIDVQGLTSRTAEGKYLVSFVDSSTITYVANAPQTATGQIGSVYSTVTPGTFYTGSQIPFDVSTGFASDNDSNSRITVTTLSPHGFADSSNFYLINTVGSKTLTLSNAVDSTAADGRPYVDDSDLVSSEISLNLSLTETKEMRSRWSTKFTPSEVNISTDTITWTAHSLRDNDCLLYVPPSGDDEIGGLDRFEIYFVKKVNDNEISLTPTYNGSVIDLTSAGTGNYGRHSLHLVYEINRVFNPYNNTIGYLYTRANDNSGVGSGWDLYLNQQLGSGTVVQNLVISRTNSYNTGLSGILYYWTHLSRGRHYSPSYGFNLVESTATPSSGNFIEDFTFWAGNNSNATSYGPFVRSYGFNTTKYRYTGTQNYTNLTNQVFVIPLIEDEEKDTFYSANHGLENNSFVSFNVDSGYSVLLSGATQNSTSYVNTYLDSGDTVQAEVVSADRFRISGEKIVQATGTYSPQAIINNPTKNSFYLPNHGFNNEQSILLSVNGTIPTANSGLILPDYGTQTGNTNTQYFRILKDAFNNHIDSNGISTVDMVTPAGNGNTVSPITTGVASGNYPLSYYSFTRGGTPAFYWNSNANQAFTAATIQTSDLYVSNFNETAPYDILTNTTGNAGANQLLMNATSWTGNSTIPFYMWTLAAKRPADTYNWALLMSDGIETYNPGAFRTYGSQNTVNYTATSGKAYRYVYWYAKHYYSTGPAAIYFKIQFRNQTDWNVSADNMYAASSSNNNTYYYTRSSNSTSYENKDDVIMGLLFYVTSATTKFNSTADFAELAQDMVERFDQNSSYPPLTNNANYRVGLVNNNRIRLLDFDTKSEVNITDKGVSPFDFSTQGNLGIIDGAYTSSGVDSDKIYFQTSARVGGATISIDAENIASDTLPVSAGSHTFISGTQVTYSTDSAGSALSGLADGSTYYVNVVDDKYFKLMSTYDDAVSGNNSINITSSTLGSHSVSTNSLAGIVLASGTITTTTGSPNIVGDNDTLFKRYFKPGDNIHIKDNNTTPGEIEIFTVTTVADDNNLTVDRNVNFSASGTSHFVETKIYARPDGYSVHRPFDGGVEIGAGTAPYSQICRQTRKYFRYQSGKGIQTSLAINFNPPITFETLTSSSTTATGRTKYPHRLSVGQNITVFGASDSTFNGTFSVATVIDDFRFTFTLGSTPVTSIPGGIIKYNVAGYSGAYTRAGMFDFQNGFFYEFDGSTLYCVRRSSTTQLSGTARCIKGNGTITGTDTNFTGQLNVGDRVVLRGQSYKVVKIDNRTTMYVQPQFRGESTTGAIITKTEDLRVPQSEWNIDRCDGTGPEGFNLDINKIQMAYMDYSWYGAGKIRFGFKDREGHVRYCHEFIHNNRLDEAYMRSGNLPAKYEIENDVNPTYAPSLFHWGTSVIMDGRFDEDEAYLFTAPSNNLSFTNGDTDAATTNANSSLVGFYNQNRRYNWYVRLSFATADAAKFYNGLKLYTSGGELNGEEVAFTQYGSSVFYVYIFIQESRFTPVSYPVVSSGTAVSLGASGAGAATVNLGTDIIPLVSLRLAPSVDGNITGDVGERDIINRMQLKLNEVGLILTHDCEVKLILNADLSSVSWENVASPSLSQLIKHQSGDTVNGGTEVFSFRAAGGSTDNTGKRLSNTSNFSLGQIIDMGNSILGGNGTFPNGPDVLTVAVQLTDTGGIDADNPFSTSARITWSESQA